MTEIELLGRTGSISGFDIDTTPSTPPPRPYTIPEILALIKNIQDNFDPDRLEELFLMMEEHIHNTDNPHDVHLDDLDTSVLEELYQEWTDRGHVGTVEEFATVLFQFVQIADDNTVLAGTSETKVVSVRGAKLIYEDHIDDPDAHYELFRAMLPGDPLDQYPVYSTHAFLGPDVEFEVERDDVLYYHLQTGYLGVAAENTLPVDYLYGHPSFPIFGERTNMALNSKEFETGSFIGGYKADYIGGRSPLGEYDASVFIEALDNTTSQHGWASETFTFEDGKFYTISVYVLAIDREYFCFELPEILAGPTYPRYSLVDPDTKFLPYGYDADHNDGEAIHLPNKWVKVVHTFEALTTMSASVKCLFLNLLDGDTTYIGEEKESGVFWQFQVEEGVGASPPIFTGDQTLTRAATIVKIPFDKKFDVKQGTLAITTNKPYTVSEDDSQYLYDLVSLYGIEGDLVIGNSMFTSWTDDVPDEYNVTGNDENNYVEDVATGLHLVSDNTSTLTISRTFDELTAGATYKFILTKSDQVNGTVNLTIYDESNGADILATTNMVDWNIDGELSYEFDLPEGCTEITITEGNDTTGTSDYIINSWSLLRVLDSPRSVIRGYYPHDHEQKLFMESINKYNTTLSYNWAGDTVRSITTYVHGYSLTEHVYGNTGDVPVVKSLIDLTVTPAEIGDYILENILPNTELGDTEVLLIDFDNVVKPSRISTDELTPSQILDIILATVYEDEKLNSEANDIVAIDILSEEETSDQITLAGRADILYVGSDRTGANLRDGYIFDITYYTQQSSAANAEFLTGEYNGE